MTTNLVDLDVHVGGRSLPVIDLAAMSKSHNPLCQADVRHLQ
jgi:hypothetical protein